MIHRINSIVGGIDFVAIIEFKFEKRRQSGAIWRGDNSSSIVWSAIALVHTWIEMDCAENIFKYLTL